MYAESGEELIKTTVIFYRPKCTYSTHMPLSSVSTTAATVDMLWNNALLAVEHVETISTK